MTDTLPEDHIADTALLHRLRGGAALPVRTTADRVPLSSGQLGMWLTEQLDPDSGSNNFALAYRLRGALHRQAIHGAVSALVDRHEILRTIIERGPDGDWQRVLPAGPIPPMVDDTSAHPDPLGEARRRAHTFAAAPYRLDVEPAFRWALIRLGEGDHLLVLCLHHIAADGWSEAIVHDEVAAGYARLIGADESAAPPLAAQYADYASWQRARSHDEGLANWRRRLDGAPDSIHLPFDHAPHARSGHAGHTRAFDVPPALAAEVTRLARREGTSAFQVLLSAFAVQLARHCGQDDIVVGVPSAGRERPEFEQLVGYFVNTLPIRLRVRPEQTFRELLSDVSVGTLAALDDRAVPFHQILDAVAPAREPGRAPLVQVLFQLQNTPARELRLPGLAVSAEQLFHEAVALDISLSLVEHDGGLIAYWAYRTELFTEGTIARWHDGLLAVLAAVTSDPDCRVDDVPAMSDAEWHTVVHEWNDTDVTYPHTRLPELFQRQVAATPDAVAVVHGQDSVTYRELNAAANRLAWTLRERGVGPDTLVGLCLERSVPQIAAVLAVLKAGGAYLPLDPGLPTGRLAMMSADAAPLLTITDDILRHRLPAEAATLSLDQLTPHDNDSNPPDPGLSADNLAYVIYTSGTTGLPKGAAITHRGLTNYLRWAPDLYDRGGAQGAPLHSPLSFDFTVTPLFLPLLAGRSIHLQGRDSLDQLADTLRRDDADFSVVKLTPSHLTALRARFDPGTRLNSLRTVILGGEQQYAEGVSAWRELAPGARFINEYGPTETVVGCTTFEVGAEMSAGPVPIGRPVANARVYVLDELLRPVPAGTLGEIYIGGTGVARGYLNRPALTADRFVPDPFDAGSGARLYRTGDLARWSADGLLEFHGRMDHQVKLRGFRIELGEIESTLLRAGHVKDAAVILREDVPGDPRLAGYWVPADGVAPTEDELRDHLRVTLPDYMVPDVLVRLAELPVTHNGKLDRARLPRPGTATRRGVAEQPRPGTETVVADAWAEVFGGRVGRTDDFFALGGHSLRAAGIAARLAAEFDGVTQSAILRGLFELPTVAALSAWLDEATTGATGTDDIIPQLDSTGPVPLSSAQRRLWFLDQMDPGRAEYAVPLVLRLRGTLDLPALRTALDRLVERHDVLRTVIEVVDGTPHAVIDRPVTVPLPTSTLDGPADRREAQLAEVLRAEAGQGIAVGTGLPLRARLVEVDAAEHVLCLTLHHIVSDAFSIEVLLDDLCDLYAAARGAAPMPAPPALRYADYTAWEQSDDRRAEIERSTDHWLRALADLPTLRLPTDRARPARRAATGARHEFILDAEVVEGIDRLAADHGATRFMVLLAGFQLLLAKYSGQRDIVVGTTVHGRHHPAAERLVGCFINLLVLRGDLSGDPDFAELVDRTRRSALDAYTHQHTPFDELVEALAVERDLSRTPLFSVLMQLVDTEAGRRREVAGLTVTELAAPTLISKYDLTLSFGPHGDSLAAELEYDAALFDEPTVRRLATHLCRLLRAVVARPDVPVDAVDLLDGEDRRRALAASRGPMIPEPAACLHDVVSAQAARTPDLCAVTDGRRALTYAELEAASNRIAHELRRRGVSAETSVAVLLDRSPEYVATLLGVLKAGGAYLPIETDTPPTRVRQLLTTSRAPLCLARPDLPESLAAGDDPAPCDVVAWHEGQWEHHDADPVDSGVTPDHLAGVYFTSGSTGLPKAVACTHGGWVNRIRRLQDIVALRPGETVLHKTTLVFDPSVLEVFWTLGHGGRLALMAPGEHRDPAAIVDAAIEFDAAHVQFVPTMLGPFLDALTDAGTPALPALRNVYSSGEALSPDLVGRFRTAFGDRVSLMNAWGLTEASVDSTTHLCTAADVAAPGESVPIGPPLPNNEVHVLDGQLRPVPDGVAGDVYIGGPGLARGYLRDPARTAAAFLPHPYANGARLYRTGDRGLRDRHGRIFFLGRVDNQVKVRGVRVELGEVETVLRAHPAVAECVVVAWQPPAGHTQLAAYVVTHRPVTPGDLRGWAAERLSRYAVPGSWQVLDTLPRHPSGKLNRKALPPPRPDSTPEPVHNPPGTTAERMVAEIWQDVLGIGQLDVDSDFFHVGGHSLLATRAIARMRSAVAAPLPLSIVFEHPTVRRCAVAVEEFLLAEIEGEHDADEPAGDPVGGDLR